MRIRALVLTLSVLGTAVAPFAAARADDDTPAVAQAKHDGQAVGEGTRKAAVSVGNGIDTTATKVGHGIRDTAIEAGHGIANGAHAVGAGFSSAWDGLTGKTETR